MADMIKQAAQLLKALGFDKERCNERSVKTLLALAHLNCSNSWAEATDNRYTTRQIMDWIKDYWKVDYKPNTRETIRRFTLHQFYEGGLVFHNDDDPSRATNSPKNCYRLTPKALKAIQSIGSPEYDTAVKDFVNSVETWKEQQAEVRQMHRIPVKIQNDISLTLSAGGQSILIKQMLDEFCSRFIPGGEVIYIDDTDKTMGSIMKDSMSRLGIEIPEHGKAPDLIVWDSKNKWLFLMEACSSHGPIDVTRKRELTRLFEKAQGSLVFVSCFPDRDIMRKYLPALAWETEAWCAENPDHMIHFDGKRFLGPYQKSEAE